MTLCMTQSDNFIIATNFKKYELEYIIFKGLKCLLYIIIDLNNKII